jgi:lysophospholipase
MKTVNQHEGTIRNVPVLLHAGGHDKITDITAAKNWLLKQQLTEFQYKEWPKLYHDVYQEPEQEEVFLYTESFMHSALRSLGYIV